MNAKTKSVRKKSGIKKITPIQPVIISSLNPVRFVQIEITTICNFQCFYCAGRDMPQTHMPMERFTEILQSLPSGSYIVSLQGEGEPTAHPKFWEMAGLVTKLGKIPYTITNGSVIDASRAAVTLPRIGVSLDTLDPVEADQIGRYKLHKVLANLDALIAGMGPDRILIHTVDYGQAIQPLRDYLIARGMRSHVVQPLQAKADYSYRYPGLMRASTTEYHYQCRYINERFMRFYDINGNHMPCGFIKDHRIFVSTDYIAQALLQSKVPESCVGCREISK